ncbi:unnamed protein product [Fraxinus pennsylvanica]|uniref:2,4-dienoyl-CoA reductase [(3E)-enoyl-CoA-producing] n=1 Tax=Fraxinus pennsylvanica TaxID=56036 RepID=A0AAD1YRI4_9LAMI|nr:unnamed protein product [Fraxinus pennsylvanica]
MIFEDLHDFTFFASRNTAAAGDGNSCTIEEWGTDYEIRVNGIAPGPIGDTTGMRKLVPQEINSKARDYMPLYKLGEKWDIAMAALYLASDAGCGDTAWYRDLFFFGAPRTPWSRSAACYGRDLQAAEAVFFFMVVVRYRQWSDGCGEVRAAVI